MRISTAALILPLVLAGCSTLNSTVQLGEPVDAEEAIQLEGVWLNSDGDAVYVRHLKDNALQVAGIEWHESEFQLSKFTAFITEDEDRRYVNLLNTKEEGRKPTFCILRLESAGDEYVLLSLPNAHAFAKAIEERVLSGKVTKKDGSLDVHLDPSAEKLSEFVTAAKVAELFDLEAPEVLRRVRRFDEKRQ